MESTVSKHQFLDLPQHLCDPEKAAVAVLGFPYEKTTSYVKGTLNGPHAIIAASSQIEFYDEELDFEPCVVGISTEMPVAHFEAESEKALAQIAVASEEKLLRQQMVVGLGGEHTISYGIIRAYKKFFPDIWVLQLDAHSDLRDTYQNSLYNHACVMSRISAICPFVGVGIRSGIAGEREKLMPPSKLFYAYEMHQNPNWAEEALSNLGDPVFITIDLDFFDPGVMPSVGTPEPGGFHWVETLAFLKKVTRSRNVVGFDVVELSPKPGAVASDFFAAKLIYKLIGYVFADK
ncbi:MAG: agmatinase [bacterium]